MKVRLVLLAVIIVLGTSIYAQRRETKPVRLEKISENLYEVLDGSGARGGAYIGDSEVLLIDSKMDKESVAQTLEELKKITDFPVKYLVNTHSDGDHVNGNRYLSKNVIFISHKNCREDFLAPGRNGSASAWLDPEMAAYVPSIVFENNLNVYMGSKKVELWYFGKGHTTGDAVIYFPEEKAAFLGDQLFLDRVQLIHKHKNGNSFEHVKTLSKMLETIPAEMYFSGHSEKTDRGGIIKHLKEMQLRQEKVRQYISDGKSLESIQGEFSNEEKAIVTSIFQEITSLGY